MDDAATAARLVLTTAGSPDDARRIASALVEERLAACVTLVPAVESIYRWHGAIENATETLLLIKTTLEKVEPLKTRLHELHSYETPEFLVIAVESGSGKYLEWLAAGLRPG